MHRLLFLALWLLCPPALASAGGIKFDLVSTHLQLDLGGVVIQDTQDTRTPAQTAAQTPAVPRTQLEQAEVMARPRVDRPYASQGSVSWWTELGAGTNFDQGWVATGGFGVEWYPVRGLALGVRADGIGIGLKETPATAGAGLSLVMRWQFLLRERWSLYFDGGCGVAGFTSAVPRAGARLNFTPQLGLGGTVRIDDRLRLMGGVRWFHVSNGQTADSNPGVDMIVGYLGLTMPF